VAYCLLQPGGTSSYSSFLGHAWIAREVQSGARLMMDNRQVSADYDFVFTDGWG